MMATETFRAHSAALQNGAIQMVRVLEDNTPVSFEAALSLLQTSETFRDFFVSLFHQAPFRSYRWETPAFMFATAGQPFEFVMIRDPALERASDASHFSEHFAQQTADCPVAGFTNLGKDAFMLVPTPQGDERVYAHLGAFLRGAPRTQIHALWRRVGEAASLRLNDRPIWLNTAGGGVPWLHVRLDTRPKYYVFKPYARVR